jgi:hypothetical protein
VLSYDREDERRARVDAIPVSAKTNKLFLRLRKMDVIVSPAQPAFAHCSCKLLAFCL